MTYSQYNITFNTGTGFNFNASEIEFVSGVMRAKSGFSGSSLVIAPTINLSGWTKIANHVFTFKEKTDGLGNLYHHKYLVSEDPAANGSPSTVVWKRYTGATWEKVSISDINTLGMPYDYIEGLFSWFSPTYLTYAISVIRDTGSPIGEIDNILINYKTDTSFEDITSSLPTEPQSDADLETDLFLPERPTSRQFMAYGLTVPMGFGYDQSWMVAEKIRETLPSLVWRCTSKTEKDSVVTFLESHLSKSFSWQQIGHTAVKYWIALEPIVVTQIESNAYDVTVTLQEVFPT
jgi:hypothetical protein